MNSVSTIRDAEIGYAIADLASLNRPFTTIDVIKHILGSYFCDRNTPAALSPNANFGKRVRALSQLLGIRLEQRRLRRSDDFGNRTTTAQWRAVLATLNPASPGN